MRIRETNVRYRISLQYGFTWTADKSRAMNTRTSIYSSKCRIVPEISMNLRHIFVGGFIQRKDFMDWQRLFPSIPWTSIASSAYGSAKHSNKTAVVTSKWIVSEFSMNSRGQCFYHRLKMHQKFRIEVLKSIWRNVHSIYFSYNWALNSKRLMPVSLSNPIQKY